MLTVELPEDFEFEHEALDLYIYNLVGSDKIHRNKITVTSNIIQIDVGHLSSGIYLLAISDNASMVKVKFSKH